MGRPPDDDEAPASLDEGTRSALGQIADVASAGALLVVRGPAAYSNDPMLRLAGEAIMRRLDDAVARLDETFLAAHPSIDWSAMRATRDIGDRAGGDYDSSWHFLARRLPVEADKVTRILNDWAWRPPPARRIGVGVAVGDHPLGAAAPRAGDQAQSVGVVEDEKFRQLVERLDDWAECASTPTDDGPIDLVLPSGRRVRIVMTAHDLSDMFVVVGDLDGALLSVMEAVRNLPDDAPYLVFGRHYALEPSAESTLQAPGGAHDATSGSGTRWAARREDLQPRSADADRDDR